MAHFPDLSEYGYYLADSRPGTKNVGWIEHGHEYAQETPSAQTLDLLWNFCSVAIVQMRGRHFCDFCDRPALVSAERHGLKLALGSAEIRVFSKEGSIYAAPNLIYHYVKTHHYAPPHEFVCALHDGPVPPEDEYFAMLKGLKLDWNRTHKHEVNFNARKLVRHSNGRTELVDVDIYRFHDGENS